MDYHELQAFHDVVAALTMLAASGIAFAAGAWAF